MLLKKRYVTGLLLLFLTTVFIFVFINNIPLYFAKNKPTNIFFKYPMFIYYGQVTNNSELLEGKQPGLQYSRDRMVFFSLSKNGQIEVNTIIKNNYFNYEYTSALTVKDKNELQKKLLIGTIDNKIYYINIAKADIKIQYEKDIDKDGFTDIVDDYQSILACALKDSELKEKDTLIFKNKAKNGEVYNAIDKKKVDNYIIYIFKLPYTDLNNVDFDNFELINKQ